MLVYATIEDFKQMKDVGKSGTVVTPQSALDKIDKYLQRATRWIRRTTRRDFIPFVQTRKFPIPYAINDLRLNKYPAAHLKLDQDLLEPITVNNGQSDLTETDDYFFLEHNIYPKNIIAVKFPNYWGGIYGGLQYPLLRFDEAIVNVTAFWGYHDELYPSEAWIDTNEVVGAGGITANLTSLSVTDADGEDDWGDTRFAAGQMLRIDNELLEVRSVDVDTNTVTVKRGVRGSTAVAHDENTVIQRWRVIDDIVEVTLQVAKIWREADIAAGGRIGVSDVSSGAEIGIPEDPLRIINSYQRSMIFG